MSKIIVDNTEAISVEDFHKQYHPEIRIETIRYWIRTNQIDFKKVSRIYLVLLTEKTLSKEPQAYSS